MFCGQHGGYTAYAAYRRHQSKWSNELKFGVAEAERHPQLILYVLNLAGFKALACKAAGDEHDSSPKKIKLK